VRFIVSVKGTQFDPAVVDAFEKVASEFPTPSGIVNP
jgi:HD-GYP domain-containing protein (c-di-GMP phosphodiesterase class II)